MVNSSRQNNMARRKQNSKPGNAGLPDNVREFIMDGGVLLMLNPYDDADVAERLAEDLIEFEEGKYIGEALTTSFVVNWADEAGELSDLVNEGAEQLGMRVVDAVPEALNLRKGLIEMLDLRDWATKADILQALDDKMF